VRVIRYIKDVFVFCSRAIVIIPLSWYLRSVFVYSRENSVV
jgi:hypothetical protein